MVELGGFAHQCYTTFQSIKGEFMIIKTEFELLSIFDNVS